MKRLLAAILMICLMATPCQAKSKLTYTVAGRDSYGTYQRVTSKIAKVVVPKCDDASWIYIAKNAGKFVFTFGKLKGVSSKSLSWDIAYDKKATADKYASIVGLVNDKEFTYDTDLSGESKTTIQVSMQKGAVLRFHYPDNTTKFRHKISVKRL